MTSRKWLAAAFGVVMAAAAAIGADDWGLVAVSVALTAVLAGLFLRVAATTAVLAVIAAIALSGPQPMLAAVSGVCAAAYLVLTHAAVTRPTAVGIAGFAAVGILATTAPAGVPWLPLLAPVAVVLIVAVALGPFLRAAE
ncbi:hypothetical protein ORI20_08685 [Mycobacterium sp. CVI_P3]|uniref:Integral membrane protein n=1 Tax=Mycobacterium pinniadriaticum TaxID=2994102 RepID=A0ABT3SAP4_9MYCO|nr:hypothetical protein [Mycobacterium pinniadriaticum]MCX2930349.1 hypothetical protein [Mycobacterium pinniadriaticum]MCX2936589.1 hypothetical protein [Mycobacterium pinniadriaticum]